MKAKSLVFAIPLLTVMILGTLEVEAAPQIITLTKVRGIVEVIPKGQEEGGVAIEGARLNEGDTIRTFDRAKAEITFENVGVIYVNSSSRLTISAAQINGETTQTKTYVAYGEMRAKVRKLAANSTFETRTPVAVAAVRGTEYKVYVDDTGATRIKVISGSVRVKSGGVWVTVKEGESTTIDPKKNDGKPSEPAKDTSDSDVDTEVEKDDVEDELNSRDIQIEEIEDKENPSSPA